MQVCDRGFALRSFVGREIQIQARHQCARQKVDVGTAPGDRLALDAHVGKAGCLQQRSELPSDVGVAAVPSLAGLDPSPEVSKACRRRLEEHAIAIGVFDEDAAAGLEHASQALQSPLWLVQVHEDQACVDEIEALIREG